MYRQGISKAIYKTCSRRLNDVHANDSNRFNSCHDLHALRILTSDRQRSNR